MSEQTPGPAPTASDDDALLAADAEPSMEDILASIRKIISDDADPLPLDGPQQESVEAVSTAAPAAAEQDDEVFDIDALMGDLDMDAVEELQPASFAESVGLSDVAFDDEELSIPDIDVAIADAVMTEPALSDDDDMDLLMDELISSMAETVVAPTPSPVAAAIPAAPTDDDMDAVKSMLADLTDDDVPTSGISDEDAFDMNALLGEIEAIDATEELSDADAEAPVIDTDSLEGDALDAMEEDIFDSILDMTLDDEVAAFDAAAEADGSAPSLADIAAAADAEADVEPVVATAVVAAAAIATASTAQAVEPDVEAAPVAAKPEPVKPAPAEMETPMPSALRSDTILDDVTETATMSAFAELNQVVEDKAILSERGPRIGDLVQDALKPMLKEWLDENIQGIVERAVAKEVKRIATGK